MSTPAETVAEKCIASLAKLNDAGRQLRSIPVVVAKLSKDAGLTSEEIPGVIKAVRDALNLTGA